jgi:rhodanese-related sulfurtransferase
MNILKSIFGSNSNNLTTQDAKARIENGQPLLILDVRQPDEYRAGRITIGEVLQKHNSIWIRNLRTTYHEDNIKSDLKRGIMMGSSREAKRWLRHWHLRTPNSISAMLSQLP